MIVITGGAGFIGSALAWKLNELGHTDLLIVDQEAEGSAKWDNVRKKSFSAYFESGHFLDSLEAGRIRDVLAVFHMGACSDTTQTDALFLAANNTLYTRRIAEWCLSNGVYLAYASSAAVYGDGARGFSDDDALAPKLKPLNLYGQSKLDFDVWAIHRGVHKAVTGFRFFNVYGPNEYHKGHMRSVTHKGFEQVRDTGRLKLFKSYKKEYPDGGQKRDFLYVKDCVEAMVWFWKNPQEKGIYNLGAGRAETWNDLARALFKAMDKPAAIDYIEMPANLKNQYQYFTEADLTKLRAAGCPTEFRNLERGVEDYVKNYLAGSDPYL